MQVGPSGPSSGAATVLLTIAWASALETSPQGFERPGAAPPPLSERPGLSSLTAAAPVPGIGRCVTDPVDTTSPPGVCAAGRVADEPPHAPSESAAAARRIAQGRVAAGM